MNEMELWMPDKVQIIILSYAGHVMFSFALASSSCTVTECMAFVALISRMEMK